MARILVTGAGGFLGRHGVAALVADGWEVIAAGRRAPDLPGLSDSLAGDLLDPAARRGTVAAARAEALLHLAWADDPRDRWHAPANLDWAAATVGLARGFAAEGGRRMVLGSSCAVYDWAAGPLLTESGPLAPRSLYGAAKAATAGLLLAGQAALGLGVAEARIFFCYGEGEPRGRLVPDLVAGLAERRAVPCTDGRQRRDYLHAADVGRALALIAGSDATGPVNVGSGRAIRVSELIEEVVRQMDAPARPALGALARPADDPDEIVADVARLEALGFRPALDLRAGVAATLGALGHAARRGPS
jgi:nucleoside-diphosphate-sugar epimerase